MSNEEKVALAETTKDDYSLPAVLAALELPRSSWYYHQKYVKAYTEKYAHLRASLESTAQENPAYGYRRTTRELREMHCRRINHKVVQRLHQEWGLPLLRSVKPPKPSGIRQVITAAGDRINLVAKKDEIGPFEVAYTDFTELVYADGRRKAHLMPIVDHASKMVLGWALGDRAVTDLALRAWEYARETLIDYGVDLRDFILHHDQDPVFTGYCWTAQLLLKDHVRISYALNGARDNPEMEAFNSRFKTENRSLLQDAQTLGELQLVVRERMDYHNGIRRHSSIDYLAPKEYVETQWLRL
ncbi:MAG: IS3 family transposase [Anaerolineales bacterium]|nr:IS3 family transposase [Anaerolineales bacterium]